MTRSTHVLGQTDVHRYVRRPVAHCQHVHHELNAATGLSMFHVLHSNQPLSAHWINSVRCMQSLTQLQICLSRTCFHRRSFPPVTCWQSAVFAGHHHEACLLDTRLPRYCLDLHTLTLVTERQFTDTQVHSWCSWDKVVIYPDSGDHSNYSFARKN